MTDIEETPYADCILGVGISQQSEIPLTIYSEKKLFEALLKSGLAEDEILEYIDFNLAYLPGFVLLKDNL